MSHSSLYSNNVLPTFPCAASTGVLPNSWTHPAGTRRVPLPDADAVPARLRQGFGPRFEFGCAHLGHAAGGLAQCGGQHGPRPGPSGQTVIPGSV